MAYDWDFGSGANPATSSDEGPVTVTYAEPGNYTVSLTVTNDQGESTSTLDVEVAPLPVPAFDFTVDEFTVTFNNTSQFADDYSWNFGDTNGSLEEAPVWTYSENGVYTVILSATNGCGTVTYETEVTINVSAVNELDKRLNALLTPNPSNGNFVLTIESDRTEALQATLLDVRGVAHEVKAVNTSVGASSVAFSLPDLAPGMYLLKITGEDGYKALKLVIE